MASVCGVAEEVLAGAVREDRLDGLAVLGQVDPLREHRRHAALVGVHDELLVADRQAALEPARGVEHEVDAGEDGRLEGRGALVGRLRIGHLRCAQVAARAERDAETPRELGDREQQQVGLRGPEGRRARLHRERRRERAEDHRGAGSDELDERHAGHRLGEGLGAAAAVVTGAIAPASMNGVTRTPGWPRRRRGRADHRGVPHERRVRVHEAEQHGVLVDERLTEQDARHRHGVAGTFRVRDRAHERLVGPAHVA